MFPSGRESALRRVVIRDGRRREVARDEVGREGAVVLRARRHVDEHARLSRRPPVGWLWKLRSKHRCSPSIPKRL